jgi:sporulation protein YlmC with PRC-barrel domain
MLLPLTNEAPVDSLADSATSGAPQHLVVDPTHRGVVDVTRDFAVVAWQDVLFDRDALLTCIVMTESGRRLGPVHAIEVSPLTSRVIALTVTAAGQRSVRIMASEIQAIGDGFIVVADHAATARVVAFCHWAATIDVWMGEPMRISA